MNREIKFRAWDEDGRQMMTVHTWSNPTLVVLDYRNMENPYFNKMACPQREIKNWKEKNIVLMQYTGLKDKNGKEIYEGDILGVKTKAIPYLIVKWDNDKSRFMTHGHNFSNKTNFRESMQKTKARKFEVIGNIYENPELLTPNT